MFLQSEIGTNGLSRVFTRDFHLATDATNIGIGSVSMQSAGVGEGHLRPIYWHARQLTEAERKYPPYALEMLAIVDAIRMFRVYCEGKTTVVWTDHKPLTRNIRIASTIASISSSYGGYFRSRLVTKNACQCIGRRFPSPTPAGCIKTLPMPMLDASVAR